MTTRVQARDAIVTLLNTHFTTNHPTLKVFWENTTEVNLDTVGDRFVRICIDWHQSRQITIEYKPSTRVVGYIRTTFFTKKGLGSRNTLALIDSFVSSVKYKRISPGITLECPSDVETVTQGNWESREVELRFFFTQFG